MESLAATLDFGAVGISVPFTYSAYTCSSDCLWTAPEQQMSAGVQVHFPAMERAGVKSRIVSLGA